jgi:pyruvate kinase
MMQKQIVKKCNQAGKPVITATQMLDSMIRNPRPTRAEASDVANAILDGSDAIMLSGETAVGHYPLAAVRTMVKIAERAEVELQSRIAQQPVLRSKTLSIAEAVSHAARETAQDLDAAAIVTPTVSGHTARMVSRYRPTVPIVAVTPSPMVQRQLCLHWGVYPLLAKRTANTDQMLADAVNTAREHGLVQPGELVVVTGGAAGSAAGTTNLIKVQVVERILTSGMGIGGNAVQGQARLIGDPLPESAEIMPSDILVLQRTTRKHVAMVGRAAGLVVVEGGSNSHAAQMAVELGLTAIVGAEDAFAALQEGQTITLDPNSGRVYEGQVRP